jgi:hypothetical protein
VRRANVVASSAILPGLVSDGVGIETAAAARGAGDCGVAAHAARVSPRAAKNAQVDVDAIGERYEDFDAAQGSSAASRRTRRLITSSRVAQIRRARREHGVDGASHHRLRARLGNHGDARGCGEAARVASGQ